MRCWRWWSRCGRSPRPPRPPPVGPAARSSGARLSARRWWSGPTWHPGRHLPDGAIVWTSGPLPGSVHDLTAARIWGIIRALAAAGLPALADKAYQSAGRRVWTPYKGRDLPATQKTANRSHARLRAPGERANAQLKTWKILTKLRSCPHRAGHLVKAIHVLHNRETATTF